MPLVQRIREQELAQQFPKNTEADLYLWLISRREELEQEYRAFGQIPDEKIIKELEEKIPSSPLERFIQHLKSTSVFEM